MLFILVVLCLVENPSKADQWGLGGFDTRYYNFNELTVSRDWYIFGTRHCHGDSECLGMNNYTGRDIDGCTIDCHIGEIQTGHAECWLGIF